MSCIVCYAIYATLNDHGVDYDYSKLGPRLKVTALIDPAIERAQAVLRKKCESFVVSAYQNTRIYKSFDDFISTMSERERPHAVIVGSPPMFRGTTKPGRDIEMQILKHLPGVPMFIEKPVATGPVKEIEEAWAVAKAIEESGVVCSVGCVPSLLLLPFFPLRRRGD